MNLSQSLLPTLLALCVIAVLALVAVNAAG
jgi:hypothetical protein